MEVVVSKMKGSIPIFNQDSIEHLKSYWASHTLQQLTCGALDVF
jgi:hypothetical protein